MITRSGCSSWGDLGAYGAEPDALWPVLLDEGIECIAGNYDVAIGRGDPDCGCGYSDDEDNAFVAIAFDYTLRHTSREFAAWMAKVAHRAPRDRRGHRPAPWCTARRWRSTTSGGSR